MNVNTAVRNMSNETLTRIAPKVERLLENRNSDGSLNLQTREDEDMLHKLVNEAHQHLPRPCMVQFAQARSAARQQAMANGTIFQGNGLSPGFSLHEDGTFTIFNSVQEREESSRQWTQNLLERMMEAITAMKATDSQKPSSGNGFNITV